MEFEKRTATSKVSIDGKRLQGIAVPYGVPTEIGGSGGEAFTEIVEPRAAKHVVDGNVDVRCLFNHDTGKVLGRTAAGTLLLEDSHRGLEFSCVLPSWADDIHESVRRGDITGMSIGFWLAPEDQKWEQQRGKAIRHITKISKLMEISVVPFPAYETGTSVSARAAQLNTVPAEVRSMAATVIEPYRRSLPQEEFWKKESDELENKRSLDAEFDRVMKLTSDYILDELHVSLRWDNNCRARSVNDQMKLLAKATEFYHMREQGWNVEVRTEDLGDGNKWPNIYYAGPSKEERDAIRKRHKRLRDFLLN